MLSIFGVVWVTDGQEMLLENVRALLLDGDSETETLSCRYGNALVPFLRDDPQMLKN